MLHKRTIALIFSRTPAECSYNLHFSQDYSIHKDLRLSQTNDVIQTTP